MFKKTLVSLVITVLLISTGFNNVVIATPQEDIAQNKIEYDILDTEILNLNSQISTLDIEIGKLTSTLEENNSTIATIENEISLTEKLIAQSEEDIKGTQDLLDNRIRSMYKNNFSTNLIESIITSTSIFDMISKVQSINSIMKIDRQVMDELQVKKEELNTTISKLKTSQNQLTLLKESTEKSLLEVNNKKSSQVTLLDELNTKKDSVFATIESNEEKLVSHPISITKSSNSISEISNAITTLNSLIQQLNSSRVIQLCKDAISLGNTRIDELKKPDTPEPESDDKDSGSSDDSSSNNNGVIKTFQMQSTAYTGGGLTAMGIKPVRIPNGISTVAVDPKVIPLGSKVHVSGYGYAIAADTGGAVKGNIVDVYLNSYSECINWGRRNVTVKLIAYPGQW